MKPNLLSLRITDLARDADETWRAVVYLDGSSRQVDRSQGCWRVTPLADVTGWQEVQLAIASELQRNVKRHERRNGATKEDTMTEASKPTKAASKPAKAKPTAKAATDKPTRKATAKPAAKKATPRISREEAKAKAAKALQLHKDGKSYAEIAKELGWANPGVAWNAVARAKKAVSK